MVDGKRAASAEPQGSSADSKRQNISWAWLWKNDVFTDMQIILLAAPAQAVHDAGDGDAAINGDATLRPPGVLLQLPAHKVVVASASNYFRRRLVDLARHQQQQREQASGNLQPPPKQEEGDPEADSASSPTGQQLMSQLGGSVVVEEAIPRDWLPAAEAVLQFMYTAELTKPCNTMMLITVARLAERWDMPLCTQACLQQLAAVTPQQLPAPLIGLIMADDLPRSVMDQPSYTPLLEACKQRMVQLFGNVQHVIMNDKIRAAFVALPLSAVKLWARLDDLKVDSENSVAVLLAHWWLHHHRPTQQQQQQQQAGSQPGAAPGPAPPAHALAPEELATQKEHAKQLSGLVRLNQLSASFFTGVLTHLPWFAHSDAFNVLLLARALHPSRGAQLQQSLRDRMPAAWLAKPRHRDDTQITRHEWGVSVEELATLHRESEHGRVLRESPGLYWCGYVWTLCMSLNGQKDALWVGVRVRSALPAAYAVPPLMEAKFTLSCKEASSKEYTRRETLSFADGAALQPSNCNGSPRLLQVPASTAPRANSLPPSSLIVDGKVHLLLQLEYMQ